MEQLVIYIILGISGYYLGILSDLIIMKFTETRNRRKMKHEIRKIREANAGNPIIQYRIDELTCDHSHVYYERDETDNIICTCQKCGKQNKQFES